MQTYFLHPGSKKLKDFNQEQQEFWHYAAILFVSIEVIIYKIKTKPYVVVFRKTEPTVMERTVGSDDVESS